MRHLGCSLSLTLALLGGCQGAQTPTDDAAASASRAASDAAAKDSVDPRDQYALAHAIRDARHSERDLEGNLARTRGAWIGQRYRWEMAFVPALCGPVGSCVVMPFDHKREVNDPIRQGWLPRLKLSAAERTALADACKDHQRCVLDLGVTLQQFELSTEQPTSLTLSDVEVHGTRAATSSESWVLGVRRPIASKKRPEAKQASDEQLRASILEGLG